MGSSTALTAVLLDLNWMEVMTAALLYQVRWTASVAVPSRWDQIFGSFLPPK